jgi:hypothetical protein
VRWLVLPTCVVAFAAAVTAVALPVGAGAQAAPAGAPQGNVTPALGPSDGKVAAAATAAPVDGRVAVLIRNDSTKTARVDLVTAVATAPGGGRVTRARSLEAFPTVLAPGELGLASVTFRRGEAPPGATIAATVRSTPVKPSVATRALAVSGLALSPPQTGPVAQTMGATVTNPTSSWTARAPKVAVMCFGEAGNPVAVAAARLSSATLRPGKQATVSVRLPTLCPAYLVAARAT